MKSWWTFDRQNQARCWGGNWSWIYIVLGRRKFNWWSFRIIFYIFLIVYFLNYSFVIIVEVLFYLVEKKINWRSFRNLSRGVSKFLEIIQHDMIFNFGSNRFSRIFRLIGESLRLLEPTSEYLQYKTFDVSRFLEIIQRHMIIAAIKIHYIFLIIIIIKVFRNNSTWNDNRNNQVSLHFPNHHN